jgi:hypothetical protein
MRGAGVVAVAVERATRRFVETVIGANNKAPRPLTERCNAEGDGWPLRMWGRAVSFCSQLHGP